MNGTLRLVIQEADSLTRARPAVYVQVAATRTGNTYVTAVLRTYLHVLGFPSVSPRLRRRYPCQARRTVRGRGRHNPLRAPLQHAC